jgi:TonB-dependent receptor
MGLLVDLAYSDLSSRYDTIQVEPYNQQTLYNGANAFVPGGFDWRTSGYDRKRVGVYEAFQWKPVPRLSLFQTFFQSYYNQYQFGVAAYNANGTSETVANGSPYTLNSSGGLTEADSIVFTGWNPVPCPASSPQCSVATTDTGTSISNFRTSDLTEGFTWDATDRLYVNGALQYVHSTSNYEGLDAFPYTVVPSFGFSISGGNPPSISVPNGAVLSVPANYFWEAAEDHFEQHAGQQLSFNTDAKYEVSDSDFLRSIKVGVRIADLREKDDVSAYNWQALTPPWDPQNTWNYLNTAPPGDVMIEQFSNFFKGQVPLPGAIVAPSFALINTFNAGLLHQMFGEPGDTVGRVPYYPYDLTLSRTRSRAVYLMASFGDDGFFGMPMNGNIGIRVVNYENESSGYASLNSTTILNNGVVVGTIPSTQIAPNSGGISYVRVLPAFNVQFLPTDDIHVRVAASQSLTNPSFNQMSASGGISFTSCPADAGGAGGGGFDVHCTSYAPGTAPLTGYGGDPKLKPQISNNVDLSLEWYGTNQSAAHIGAFYKSIDDYLEYGTFQSTNVTLTLPGGTYTFPFQMTNYFNTSQPATVEGFETGATKFFDFLPDPFDGIGIDANFTYIQSSSPGDQSCFLFPAHVTPAPGAPCGASQPSHGLPVEQLSKYNYNLTAMYEKGPVSLRLAYNWRSKYLLVASGANGTGTLPVFGASYGQLDFGASYKINEHVTLSLDGQNMTDSMNKTLMGYQDSVYGNQQYGRSWFISDRRFVGTLKFSF